MNTGNVNMSSVSEGWVSALDIAHHLQRQLGFPITVAFTRYKGAKSTYVIMKVGIDEKYYAKEMKCDNFVDQFLRDNGRGFVINNNAKEVLKKYAYPSNMMEIYNHKNTLDELAGKGIYGAALDELVWFSDMRYSPRTSQFGIYLKPEAIIKEMVSDPASGLVGDFSIDRVEGHQDPRTDRNGFSIRWLVRVVQNNQSIEPLVNKDLDLLFSTAYRQVAM